MVNIFRQLYCGIYGILLLLGFNKLAYSQELVIATTFSPESASYIVKEWGKHFPEQKVRLINRTSSSLKRLLENANMEKVDLILSSSPFLFQELQDKNLLIPLPEKMQQSIFVPSQLKQTTVAIAFSGYGILYNKQQLRKRNLNEPVDWDSLFDTGYYNDILVSSPSRSGTNHIMLEMLLQQRGWDNGWKTFLTLTGNISLISSRSFNVTEKIKAGLATAGISIDSYATHNLNNDELGFVYFPHSIVSPTFVAVYKNHQNKEQALALIQFLLSKEGQIAIATPNVAKFPLYELEPKHHLAEQQKRMLSEPMMDHNLLIARQHLVEKLFDIAITFRINQLKEVWNLIYKKEKESHQQLLELRRKLTALPVTEHQATDPVYLSKLKNDRHFLLEQEKQWSQFFQINVNQVLAELGEIE